MLASMNLLFPTMVSYPTSPDRSESDVALTRKHSTQAYLIFQLLVICLFWIIFPVDISATYDTVIAKVFERLLLIPQLETVKLSLPSSYGPLSKTCMAVDELIVRLSGGNLLSLVHGKGPKHSGHRSRWLSFPSISTYNLHPVCCGHRCPFWDEPYHCCPRFKIVRAWPTSDSSTSVFNIGTVFDTGLRDT